MHDTKLRHHQYTLVTPDVVFSTVELEHMKSSSPCREQVFLRVGACRNRVPYISTVVVVVVVVVVVASTKGVLRTSARMESQSSMRRWVCSRGRSPAMSRVPFKIAPCTACHAVRMVEKGQSHNNRSLQHG